jgi:hypothetical protein
VKAIWPSNRYLSPKARAFIDFMAKHGLSQINAQNSSEAIQAPKHGVVRLGPVFGGTRQPSPRTTTAAQLISPSILT